MPEALEKKLKAEAKNKGLSKERMAAYVYGTMRKTGWVPSTQKDGKKSVKEQKPKADTRELAMKMRANSRKA